MRCGREAAPLVAPAVGSSAPVFPREVGGRAVVMNVRVLSAPLTGVQRYVLEIARHLPGPVGSVAPRVPLRGACGHAWEQFWLPAMVRGRLLWSPSNTGPLAVGRQVLTLHDMAPLDHPEWLSPRFAAWYRYLLPRLVRRVRRVIAVSEFTRERILAHVPGAAGRVTVIAHGVDLRFYPRTGGEVAAARERLGLPELYLLSVGGMGPRKNLGRLLTAWANVQGALPAELVLAVVGAPPDERIFGSGGQEPQPPRTRFLGHVADEILPALYSGASAFLYPSSYEGFGWPPLEAMACGVPVVAGRGTALDETLGDSALLVDPLDRLGLAEAIEAVVGDEGLRSDLRGRGLLRAASFRWDVAAARTWEVLQAEAGGSS
jgi:glycosyltransferase involved in cell wall biosynthesis